MTKANLPPSLTSEGARVNPEWLKQFLANPSLSTTDQNKNGVRSYLQVRMPTFFLSDDEIRKLVLFFEAISSQAEPYIPEKRVPLTATETAIGARSIYESGSSLLEVPRHRRSDARQDGYCAQFTAGGRTIA